MKNIVLYFLFGLFFIQAYQIKALDISVSSAAFHKFEKAYVEVYIYIVGQSVRFDTLEGGIVHAAVELIITIESGNEIVNFDKFILNSPSGQKVADFIGLKRFALKNGTYQLKVEAVDTRDPDNTFSQSLPVVIDFNPNMIQLSDIQLLSSLKEAIEPGDLVKGGYLLETVPYHFFNKKLDNLGFYVEVYNKSEDTYKAAYLRYAIYQKNGVGKDDLIVQKYKKLDAGKIQPILQQMSIDQLRSGNYELIVEIRNQDKLLVDAKSIFFQRSKPSLDLNELMKDKKLGFENSFAASLDDEQTRYSLKAIAPLCRGIQSSILEELFLSGDHEAKRYFLYNFFYEQLPSDPGFAYSKFMEVANAIDRTYRSNVGYGFETDRGIIFLKYGKPTEIVEVENEPSAPPYEIWFYDLLEESKQVNIKFIFHNPSLANNDFVLLHSNCRGERNNPRWEVELYKNAPGQQSGNNAASTNMEDNYRRNARRIWEEL